MCQSLTEEEVHFSKVMLTLLFSYILSWYSIFLPGMRARSGRQLEPIFEFPVGQGRATCQCLDRIWLKSRKTTFSNRFCHERSLTSGALRIMHVSLGQLVELTAVDATPLGCPVEDIVDADHDTDEGRAIGALYRPAGKETNERQKRTSLSGSARDSPVIEMLLISINLLLF